MISKSRIRERGITATAIILIILAMGVYSCSVHAQSLKTVKYMGLEGSFGIRSFKINSNVVQLNGMGVMQEGGSLGMIFGNDLLRAKIRAAGFYYSASGVPRTIDLFESEAILNFYPLQYIRQKQNALDIYLLGGLSMDNIKFYGQYLVADQMRINYSTSSEPYLGKISQINASAGIGLEYQLPMEFDFVHLFMEAKYAARISGNNSAHFKETAVKNFAAVSLGVSFGVCR
ncbi:MAG TPA: hypothetical protein VK666_14160 [Chryseolinea sp.]|nr:hypothetical protein [Chryseolinea sp.]